MKRSEFIKRYCERSKVTWEELKKYMIAVRCKCGERECQGWQMASRDPLMIKMRTREAARKRI